MTRDELLQTAQDALTHVNNGVPYYAPEFHGAMLHSIACTLLAETQKKMADNLQPPLTDDEEEAIRWAIAQAMDAVRRYENTLLATRAKALQGLLTRLK